MPMKAPVSTTCSWIISRNGRVEEKADMLSLSTVVHQAMRGGYRQWGWKSKKVSSGGPQKVRVGEDARAGRSALAASRGLSTIEGAAQGDDGGLHDEEHAHVVPDTEGGGKRNREGCRWSASSTRTSRTVL